MVNDYSHDFSKSKVISFDVETHDPNLFTKGPSIMSGGFVLGIGLEDETRFKSYYNLDHPGTTDEENETNLKYLKNIFKLPNIKLGMNILYDMDWIINSLGFKINGSLIDIMVAEGLIDENQIKYNMNSIALNYLLDQKSEDPLITYCRARGWKGKPQEHFKKIPASIVGPYCEDDCSLALNIWEKQVEILNRENLTEVFDMEMRLLPVLIMMRGNGVRVDRKKIFEFEDYLSEVLTKKEAELLNLVGYKLNYNSGDQIGHVCDKMDIPYELTPKSKKPSFTKPFLEENQERYKLFDLILSCRKYYKMLNTFVESQLLGQLDQVNGEDRIYPQFHSSKSDKGGTVTGRLSGSNPNLQFIPNPKSEINKDEDVNLGNAMREVFIPEREKNGVKYGWGKIDYSQIEIRGLAHYAVGERSGEIKNKYLNPPSGGVDYHKWCSDLSGVSRHEAKKVNFSIIYGMGIKGVAAKLGISFYDGKEFMENYLSHLPFIKATLNKAKEIAENRGYVRTILNRRRRFPIRKHAYKALNAIIQGTAADIMKKGMVDAYEVGIFNTLILHLTVHDELDFSYPINEVGFNAIKDLKTIMENTIKLSVPIVADIEIGPNWSNVSEKAWEDIVLYNGGLFNGNS